MKSTVLSLFLGLLAITSTHLVAAKAGIHGPLLPYNLGDPCVVQDGDRYYAFATSHFEHNGVHVPGAVSSSSELRGRWKALDKGKDLLPNGPGAWAFQGSKAQVGSPDVNQLPDGSWILYYSANPKHQGANKSKNLKHCIGIAKSKKGVLGPYRPRPSHFICNKGGKGTGFQAPNFFHDVQEDKFYVVYKNGSSFDVQNGGHSEIWLQQVRADGETKIGEPNHLLTSTHTGDEREDAEGPALVRNPVTNNYMLFYDGGFFANPTYHIEYAVAKNIHGPYNPSPGTTLLASDTYQGYNLTAPGAPDFVGNSATEFTFISQAHNDFTGGRRLYAGRLKYDGDTIHLATGGGS